MSIIRNLLKTSPEPGEFAADIERLDKKELAILLKEIESIMYRTNSNAEEIEEFFIVCKLLNAAYLVIEKKVENDRHLSYLALQCGGVFGMLANKTRDTKLIGQLIAEAKEQKGLFGTPQKMNTVDLAENPNMTQEQAIEITYVPGIYIGSNLRDRLDVRMSYKTLKRNHVLIHFFKEITELDTATFDTLAEKWDGSLQELIQACKELGPGK